MSEAPSSADAAQGLALAARAGIHRLAIPTPFAVGRVNCYLIDDEPLTLVDTGPNSGKSLDELELALGSLGRRIEDIELLVLTHQHMDHLGLMEIIARRSGAEVAALDLLDPYLADFSASSALDDAFAQAVMRRHGVPSDLAIVLGAVGAAFRAFGSSGQVARPLRHRQTLRFRDRTLRVLHRPGHSPTDTLFWDERQGLVLGGDHLLGHISSNPMISRPLGADATPSADPAGRDDRPRALVTYIASMRETRELPARLVLPGHGDPIVDHAQLIDERLGMHQRRARKILAILRDRPLSAYEIALRMWGNVAVTQAYLTISEVLGHLDLLTDDGLVAEHDDGEHSSFEALDERSDRASAAPLARNM